MSGQGNEGNHELPEVIQSSTESSQCTESTESRACYNTPLRRTSKALLERRRQDLPKASSLEQAYLRNSRRQIPYHPTQQQKQQRIPNGIIQTIRTTHQYRIQQLENQVAEDQIKLNEYATELRTMKTQQKRLEVELKKYQGMAGNIPNFMRGHEEDVRTLQHELKKAKHQSAQLHKTITAREEELRKVQQENDRWRKLEDLRQLEEQGKLYEQNQELKEENARQNEKILMLTRKGMLEAKNLKHELATERKKHRETQQSLDAALLSVEKLRADLDMKQKHLMYNSLRFSSHPKRTPANNLESISLITLTGNRYGSVQNQVDLDPELAPHYRKLSIARPRNHLISSKSAVSLIGNDAGHATVPHTSVYSSREPLNNVSQRVSTNVSIRKSPTIPLSDIQSDEDEGSNLSEEDIDLYSSTLGSNSRKDSLLTSSQKSSSGHMKEYAESSGSDSDVENVSNRSGRNRCSLPNLVPQGHGDCADSRSERRLQTLPSGDVLDNQGQHPLVSEVKVPSRKAGHSVEHPESSPDINRSPSVESQSHESIIVGERQNSTESQANVSHVATVQAVDKHSTDQSEPNDENSKENISITKYVNDEQKCIELENNQVILECDSTKVPVNIQLGSGDKTNDGIVLTQLEESLKFNQEVKQEIDPMSKGKLLAALDAIDKGEEPVMEHFRSKPRPASIFTAARSNHSTYKSNREKTEEFYSEQPAEQDDNTQMTRVNKFRSNGPLQNPSLTKAELMKELFGVGQDADSNPSSTKLDVVPQSRNIPYEQITFSDRNNNEPDGDVFYPNARLSLTNWKH